MNKHIQAPVGELLAYRSDLMNPVDVMSRAYDSSTNYGRVRCGQHYDHSDGIGRFGPKREKERYFNYERERF